MLLIGTFGASLELIMQAMKACHNDSHLADLPLQMLEVLNKCAQGEGTRKPLPGEEPPFRAKTKRGLTPMMVAVKAGHDKSALFLLSVSLICTYFHFMQKLSSLPGRP